MQAALQVVAGRESVEKYMEIMYGDDQDDRDGLVEWLRDIGCAMYAVDFLRASNERPSAQLRIALTRIQSLTSSFAHGSWESNICAIATEALQALPLGGGGETPDEVGYNLVDHLALDLQCDLENQLKEPLAPQTFERLKYAATRALRYRLAGR